MTRSNRWLPFRETFVDARSRLTTACISHSNPRFTMLSSLTLATLLLALPTVRPSAPQTPVVPYVPVFQLCANVPQGQYCNAAFPRSFISCPNGITEYCPPHQVCQNGDVLGTVKCVPNLWDPIVQLCTPLLPSLLCIHDV